ncbi:MAG TPA: PQQ-binding-like beta-propeller repeat protein [Longimicrobium sp.]
MMQDMLRITAAAALFYTLLMGAGCAPDPTQPAAPADSIQVAWRIPLGESGAITPGFHDISADDERLYVLWKGVTAYDLGTGEQRWQVPRTERGPDNVVARDGRVFTSSDVARALNAATGAELWRFVPDAEAAATTAVDERAFYIGTESRRVYALDVSTGRPLWSAEVLPRGPHPSQVTGIVAHGDSLYVSLVEDTSPTGHLKRGWIVAVDRLTGAVLWRWVNEKADEPHDAGRHAVAGRMLLVNDLNGGAFIGVDRFTGREVWRHVGAGDRFGARDVAKVADGVAYLASNDTRTYAFDPESGRIRWEKDIRASASSSAICGDSVLAAAGSLHMLRRSDGEQKATLFLDREGFVLPDEFVVSRLLSHRGRVYFVGYKAVYAVECS